MYQVLGLLCLAFSLNASTLYSINGGQTDGTSCSEFELCVDIGQCFTQFKNFADAAKHSCGRGKVFCRNIRNPCEIFQKHGLLYATEDAKCYKPQVQGPCRTDHWLVTTTDEMFLSCQPKPCSDVSHVLMAGKCRPYHELLCPGFGEVWVSIGDGSAVCICDTGFARGLDGNCHQVFTKGYKGYCKGNTVVYEINNKGLCVENPCQKGKMPHLHTWSRLIKTADDVTCHRVIDDISECEVEVNDDDELVCGSIRNDQEASLVKYCVGDSCCGKRRVWCPFRMRCVPIFFG
eukprot:GFUD01025618.1.p1 GENE.GFUD01025618.1~~GFUD01025618.1.p1  ORF type:complete len:290 (+),score=37.15 GFUD01025618.1:302-1171(+)